MRLHKIYLVVLVVYFSQLLVAQPDKSLEENTIIDVIPFELTAHNNISVKAILNSLDTIDLMFHTVASSITLTEESVKNINSIKWNKEYDVKSWGGKSSARYSESNSLQIGKMHWDSLAIWESKNSGPTTDGKFGPNLFEGEVVEIDFDNSNLVIHESLPSKIKAFEKLNLVYEDDFMLLDGMSVIDGIDYPNRFLIHSGYGGAILYDDEFVASNNLGERLEVVDESELKDSYGNVLKTKKTLLPVFKIGDITFENIPAGFFEGAISNQSVSVLGGNILKRFNIIIDADRETIYLQKSQFMDSVF